MHVVLELLDLRGASRRRSRAAALLEALEHGGPGVGDRLGRGEVLVRERAHLGSRVEVEDAQDLGRPFLAPAERGAEDRARRHVLDALRLDRGLLRVRDEHRLGGGDDLLDDGLRLLRPLGRRRVLVDGAAALEAELAPLLEEHDEGTVRPGRRDHGVERRLDDLLGVARHDEARHGLERFRGGRRFDGARGAGARRGRPESVVELARDLGEDPEALHVPLGHERLNAARSAARSRAPCRRT